MPDAPADTAPDAAAAAPPRRSPLHAVHEAAGASFTDFAGWLMPVRYTSDLAEHRAVREAAGIFDISHMAEIAVEGEGAAAFLDSVLAGRLSAIAEWQAKYTLLLDPSGGIVDDLIVYRTGEESFLVVANAGNHDPVLAVLAEAAAGRDDVEGDDASDDVALIAVQGPVSRAILEATAGLETERRSRRSATTGPRPRASPARTCSSPAPATRARTATSCTSRPRTPSPCGRRSSRPARPSAS